MQGRSDKTLAEQELAIIKTLNICFRQPFSKWTDVVDKDVKLSLVARRLVFDLDFRLGKTQTRLLKFRYVL